jgi:hypothetical protein
MTIFGISKILFSYYYGKFFFACGIVSLILGIAKIFTIQSIRHKVKIKSFNNVLISVLVLISGIVMVSIVLYDFLKPEDYSKFPLYLSFIVTIISSIEFLLTIIGLFKVSFKGHYYRNIKMINLCQAFSSLLLTTRVLVITSKNEILLKISDLNGLATGILIIIIAILMFVAIFTSIYDKLHHEYEYLGNDTVLEHYSIKLHDNYLFGDFTYEAYKCDKNVIDGNIIKHRPRFYNSNLVYRVFCVLIFPLIIVPYLIILIFELNYSNRIVKKLNKIMNNLDFKEIVK